MKSYFMALSIQRRTNIITGLILEADQSISGSYKRLGFAKIPLSALMHGQCCTNALSEDRYLDIHVNSGVIKRTLDAKGRGEDPFSWDPSSKTLLETETEGDSRVSKDPTPSVEPEDKKSCEQPSLSDDQMQEGDNNERSATESDDALSVGDDDSSEYSTENGFEIELPVGDYDVQYTIRVL